METRGHKETEINFPAVLLSEQLGPLFVPALHEPHEMPRGNSSPSAALLFCSSAGVPCYIHFIPACPSTVGILRQRCALCLCECAQEILGYLGNLGDTESPPPEMETKNPCRLEHPTPRPAIPSLGMEVVGRERINHSESLLIHSSADNPTSWKNLSV